MNEIDKLRVVFGSEGWQEVILPALKREIEDTRNSLEDLDSINWDKPYDLAIKVGYLKGIRFVLDILPAEAAFRTEADTAV